MHYAAIRYNLQKTRRLSWILTAKLTLVNIARAEDVLRRGLSDCRKRFWMRKDLKDQQRDKHFGEFLLARETSILVGGFG